MAFHWCHKKRCKGVVTSSLVISRIQTGAISRVLRSPLRISSTITLDWRVYTRGKILSAAGTRPAKLGPGGISHDQLGAPRRPTVRHTREPREARPKISRQARPVARGIPELFRVKLASSVRLLRRQMDIVANTRLGNSNEPRVFSRIRANGPQRRKRISLCFHCVKLHF